MDGPDGDGAAIEWGDLRDVYGTAEQVPLLLAAAEAASPDDSAVWGELWGRLCHQGTVSAASYAALPALTGISRRQGPSGYVPALHLAADIVASTDGPQTQPEVRHRYASEVAELAMIADRNLDYATGDTEFGYGLQALAAFEDAGVWQRNLHALGDGEAQFDCPSCSEGLLLDLGEPPFLVCSFADQNLPAVSVVSAEPTAETVEHRLLQRARAASRTSVAELLTTLFGVAACPRCRCSFEVADALV